jgi:hypothetical protein
MPVMCWPSRCESSVRAMAKWNPTTSTNRGHANSLNHRPGVGDAWRANPCRARGP